MLKKNSSLSVGYTYEESIETGYEESFKETLTNSTKVELNAGVNAFDLIKSDSTVSNEISNSSEIGINFSKTYTTTKGFTISMQTPYKDYDAFYAFCIRARFDVYKICLYEINYDEIKTINKTWYGKKYNSYEYKFSSCKLIDETYRYSYIDNTKYDGLFSYIEQSNGKMKLNMDKNENYTYLD